MDINNEFLELLHKLGTLEGVSPEAAIELSNEIKNLRSLVSDRLVITEGATQEEFDLLSVKSSPFNFTKVLREMLELYLKKNHDYGNSFSETIQEFGYTPAIARINDKIKRVKQIVKGEPMQINETMRDNLIDIANYCILTVIELDKENDSKDNKD